MTKKRGNNKSRLPALNLIPDHMFQTEQPRLIMKGSLGEMGMGGRLWVGDEFLLRLPRPKQIFDFGCRSSL